MGIEIPLLENKIASGAGKLGRSAPIRQTSGVETGRCLLDLSLIHVIANEDEAALCDGFAPGTSKQYRMAFGDGSDGIRTIMWKPAEQDYRLRIVHVDADGKETSELFAGPACLRAATLRMNAKHAVLTLTLRLTAVDPDVVPRFARSFGEAVAYTVESVDLQTAGKPGDAGPLFAAGTDKRTATAEIGAAQGAQDVRRRLAVSAGDLITVAVPPEESDDGNQPTAGRVVSVGTGGQITAHRWLDGTSPFVIPHDDVLSVTRICGPKGGDAGDAIRTMVQEAENNGVVVEPTHLLDALLQSSALTDNGWPITADVRERAIEIAASAMPSEV